MMLDRFFAKLVSVPLPANPAILNIAGPEGTTLATIASLGPRPGLSKSTRR